jgi:hypothetical protein
MKGNGGSGKRWRGKQQEDPSIYIGASQRADPTVMVTPFLNALPNGPNFPTIGYYGFHPGGRMLQWLSLEKVCPTGKKTNHRSDSFHCKVSPA